MQAPSLMSNLYVNITLNEITMKDVLPIIIQSKTRNSQIWISRLYWIINRRIKNGYGCKSSCGIEITRSCWDYQILVVFTRSKYRKFHMILTSYKKYSYSKRLSSATRSVYWRASIIILPQMKLPRKSITNYTIRQFRVLDCAVILKTKHTRQLHRRKHWF